MNYESINPYRTTIADFHNIISIRKFDEEITIVKKKCDETKRSLFKQIIFLTKNYTPIFTDCDRLPSDILTYTIT